MGTYVQSSSLFHGVEIRQVAAREAGMAGGSLSLLLLCMHQVYVYGTNWSGRECNWLLVCQARHLIVLHCCTHCWQT
jgi:hypothetical protein